MKQWYKKFKEDEFKELAREDIGLYLDKCGMNLYLVGGKAIAEKDLADYIEQLKKPVIQVKKEAPKRKRGKK